MSLADKSEMNPAAKPRMVFFSLQRGGLPAFIRLHAQEHAKCLQRFFDLTVVASDCDYAEVCAQYRPDIALFESGVYARKSHIANTSAYPEIPKLGFCNADPFCASREVFLADMDRWGVDTFFTHAVTMAEHTPEIADHLFSWPNFADPDIFRDYGEYKAVPVLLTGSRHTLYPWRNRISEILARNYTCLVSPHFGWVGEKATARTVTGEEYARMINASWFVPTCGTMAKELVRKHFEIPAANACLITEKSPATDAAGFVDGVNCIYTEGPGLVDRIDYLTAHRDELESMIRAGHDLVYSRHTLAQRDQIFQWYELWKNLSPDQRIVQPGPFEPLVVVPANSPIQNGHLASAALDRALLREAELKLSAGRYDEAEALLLSALNYYPENPEPRLGLTRCSLYKGNSERAIYWVTKSLLQVLAWHDAAAPDPVEWAYFIISLLCQGNLGEARRRADQFPSLHHPELDRIRIAVAALSASTNGSSQTRESSARRYSVHGLPELSFAEWLRNLAAMLNACGQPESARSIGRIDPISASRSVVAPGTREAAPRPADGRGSRGAAHENGILPLTIAESPAASLQSKAKSQSKKLVLDVLRAMEDTFGPFLPYRISKLREDEFLSKVQKLAMREDVKKGVVIGASAGEASTEAFLIGMHQNPNRPVTYCTNEATSAWMKLRKDHAGDPTVRCDEAWLQEATNPESPFDAALIDCSEVKNGDGFAAVYGARYILLDDINAFYGHRFHETLTQDRNYALAEFNPAHRNGYAIFRKVLEGRADRAEIARAQAGHRGESE